MVKYNSEFNSNYVYKYSFSNQLNKILSFDKIRIAKIIEIFQYSLIAYILVLIFTTILNRIIFVSSEEEIKNMSTIYLLIQTFFELFFIIIIMFYLKKIIILFPSIPSLYFHGFKEHTTIDYIIHTSLIFFFLEIITNLKFKMEIIHDRMINKKVINKEKI